MAVTEGYPKGYPGPFSVGEVPVNSGAQAGTATTPNGDAKTVSEGSPLPSGTCC